MKTIILFLSFFLSVSLFGQFTPEPPLCHEIDGYEIKTGGTQSCDSIIPTSYTGIVKRCVVEEYLSKDSIVREYTTYKNGIKHGVSRYWTDDGFFYLYSEEYFDNGVLNGVSKVWRDADSNNLRYLKNYKNGKNHGKSFTWNWNGNLISEYNFKDGEFDGVQRSWYDNGQLYKEGNYKDGKMDGSQKVWHENGQLASEIIEKACDSCGRFSIRISEKAWYDTGELKIESFLKEGTLLNKEWYKSGQIKKIEELGGPSFDKCWDEKGNVIDCYKKTNVKPAKFN